jgi:hypothetical protein
MTKWIGAAILALSLIGGSAAVDSAAAASLEQAAAKPDMRDAASVRGHRHVRHHAYARYVYRPYVQPTYLDRPYYYAPAPNFALAFGFGFGPWW